MMVVTSFDKTANISLAFPPKLDVSKWSLYNYSFVIKNYQLTKYFLNTMIVTAVSVFIILASSLVAGYGYSMLDFPFKKQIFLFSLGAMMIPGALTLIPGFLLIKAMGLYNSYFALWIPLFGSVYNFFFAKQFIDSLPGDLRSAAQIDGLGELNIFLKIYLPLCGPILATLGILQFIGVYNDMLGPLIYLKDTEKHTLTVRLAFITAGRNTSAHGVNMALSVLTMLPIIIMFTFFQRYIIESIAVTGIKD